jgi:hypothetical protein
MLLWLAPALDQRFCAALQPSTSPLDRHPLRLANSPMPYATTNDGLFDREITLRDAYRIMERFLSNYLSRGDTQVSDFLHTYAGEIGTGQSTDPTALYDFLGAAEDVLGKR